MASLATLSDGCFFFFLSSPSQQSPYCPISVHLNKNKNKNKRGLAISCSNPSLNPRSGANNGSEPPQTSPSPSSLPGLLPPRPGNRPRLGFPPDMPARYRKSVQRRRLARSQKLSSPGRQPSEVEDLADGNCVPPIEASNAQSLGTLQNKPHMEWNLPFEFQYSYTETPKVEPIGYREPQFSLFGPTTMPRPWQGGRPRNPSKKKLPEFDSFNPPPPRKKGVKYVQSPGPFPLGQGPKEAHTREEIQGEPLSGVEVKQLIDSCKKERRRVTLGRDGLTHNMIDLIHLHWKRRRVCKVKCLGVPTVDMDNLCFHLEDKTGGQIIYRVGGMVYLFRGRNYNYKDRPKIPLVLLKPASPIYPRLIEPTPDGLTKEEAAELRRIGRKVEPLCKIGKNGACLNLVRDIRNAFEVDKLVRVNCEKLNPSDFKKLGAKLRDLVPCVLLSFEQGHILMGRAGEMEEETHSRDCLDGGLQSVLEERGGVLSEEGRGLERVLQTDLEANKLSSDGSSSFPLGLLPKKAANRNHNYAYVYSQRAIEKVNALWSEALENGVAFTIEEGAALDSDLVLMKVEEFAKVAPPGPVYICQAERIRERQKLLHQVKVDPPSLEEHPMGELPVDNLAQLLVS